MTGAEFILTRLKELGTNYFFGVPGLQVDPFYKATLKSGLIPIINCHELSAGYMASGYSKGKNKLGVIVAIGSPGAYNLLGAVNTSKLEGIPLLIITGDVPSTLKTGPGFQTSGSYGSEDDRIFQLCSKFSKRVESILQLPKDLDLAIEHALSVPCGPSHLIVPNNLLKERLIKYKKSEFSLTTKEKTQKDSITIEILKNLILSDDKIIFWAGTSCKTENISSSLCKISKKFSIPIVTTYSGKGIIPESDELSFGNFGFAGSVNAHRLMLSDEIDTVIAFDVEQNERNTYNWDKKLYNKKNFHFVDFPKKFYLEKIGVTHKSCPHLIIQELEKELNDFEYDLSRRRLWIKILEKTSRTLANNKKEDNSSTIETGRLVKLLHRETHNNYPLFVDAGNHRIFPGWYWESNSIDSFFSAEVSAPLGWAICAGIGYSLASNKPTIILTGDGCMQMHGMEIKTAIRHKIPILIVLVNNNALGSIKMRYSNHSEDLGALADIHEINWTQFMRSMGGVAYDIYDEDELIRGIKSFTENEQPILLNVRTPLNPHLEYPETIKAAYKGL
jgi:acetolactate synthase-1/2/3 large subunit